MRSAIWRALVGEVVEVHAWLLKACDRRPPGPPRIAVLTGRVAGFRRSRGAGQAGPVARQRDRLAPATVGTRAASVWGPGAEPLPAVGPPASSLVSLAVKGHP